MCSLSHRDAVGWGKGEGMRFAMMVLAALAIAAMTEAASITHSSAKLAWTAPGDDDLLGTAAQYDLRYSTSEITPANFDAATRWLAMPVPSAPGAADSVTVTGLSPLTGYWFAIKTADEVPNWAGISNLVQLVTLAVPDTIPPAPITDFHVP